MEVRCWCWWSIVALLVAAHCCIACFPHERDSLLLIKKDINPQPSKLQNWKGDDCCSWESVMCNSSTYRVQELHLDGVRGEESGKWYPNATLFAQFKQLSALYLSSNQIAGWRMPQGLCELTNLHELFLSNNDLDDQSLPQCLWKLLKMETLDLSNNNLRGHFFSSSGLCELRKLKSMNLGYNSIEGRIPSCIGYMQSLEELYLSENQISGSIGPLGNLSSLSEISLDGNNLGMLEFSTLANLSLLLSIDLSNNPMLEVETESPTWLPSFELSNLYLSNTQVNKRSGNVIPSFLATQDSLKVLDLSNTHLTGNIPNWLFYNLTGAYQLKLSDNQLGGSFPLPSQGISTSYLGLLDISNNLFEELIPANISIFFPSLLYLNLSGNTFRGEISLNSNMASLEVLDLSRNNFSGEIHKLLANCPSLIYLSLSNNRLHGDIPFPHSNLTALSCLFIDGNGFTKTVSRMASNSTKLLALNFRRNFFKGIIPNWLPTLGGLSFALFSHNGFHGPIPTELCQMQSLHFLDLSNNRLSGTIPSCLHNISAWMNKTPVDLSFVDTALQDASITSEFSTKGNLWSYEGIPLSLMTGVDFSLNQLTGNIPKEMGYLRELHSLNLSHNHLMGDIPESFQYLKNIESLDLSHNRLIGRIPPQLTSLDTLGTFNVAFNNLSGALPNFEGHFITFSASSYEGNPGLCGKPLERNCTSNNPSYPPHPAIEEEDDTLRFVDNPVFFYSFVAASYALGFWGFIILLALNGTWRKKFFLTADRFIEFCREIIRG